MDLVYKPELTTFLERAAAAGCRTINGYDMFIRQAYLQYACFEGKEIPIKLLSRLYSGAATWTNIQQKH
jgi:shikimate 5-dehydrogenase